MQSSTTNGALPIPNETYQGIRLTYQHGLDPSFVIGGGVSEFLSRFRWALLWGTGLAWLVTVPLFLVSAPFIDNGGDLLAQYALNFMIWVTLVVLMMFVRRATAVASWTAVADGMGGLTRPVFDELGHELQQIRQVTSEGVRATHQEDDQRGRYGIELRHKSFFVTVTIVAFGTDLHVGWAMVERRHAFHALHDAVRRGSTSFLQQELEMASAKALRDATHHALNNALAKAAARQPMAIDLRGADEQLDDLDDLVPVPDFATSDEPEEHHAE